MHITSLPSPYGIGTMGKAARDFVDFLEKCNQRLWQILPITPTSYGDSPYQSFSTFAGNPYFIDLDILFEEGLLKKEEYALLNWGENNAEVDYALIYENRFNVLKKAFERFIKELPSDYNEFCSKTEWLNEYALYMAIKMKHNGRSWCEWEKELRTREKSSIDKAKEKLKKEIEFWKFVQYEFFKQWKNLKAYANQKGIEIIGDIPIYVALDSADVWANPEMFMLDEERNPIEVAGCPPDFFSKTGQLWGNPLYNWEYCKKTNYNWWVKRIESASEIYDTVRIDHFRGFESFWAIPAKDDTAVNGCWKKGPGIELFNTINSRLKNVSIIAEDLGLITEPVKELLKECGYPGMKVLQFAFNAGSESEYLPFNYEQNCICYTGTHDNDTILGWLNTINSSDLEYVMQYTRSKDKKDCIWGLISLAWSSSADTAITQLQDFLELDRNARMNIPSTPSGNWKWRVTSDQFTEDLAIRIKNLTKLYWR